jgi:hypothetical protein
MIDLIARPPPSYGTGMAASNDDLDNQSMPDDTYHQLWRQGMGLCRFVTDTALDLCRPAPSMAYQALSVSGL